MIYATTTDGSVVTNICLPSRRLMFNPWVGMIPWKREWQPTPVFLPGQSHGQRNLASYSPQGRKESDMTEHKIPYAFWDEFFSFSQKKKNRWNFGRDRIK